MPSQSFDAFFRALRKGEIAPAIYLHGPEDVLKEEAVNELIEKTLDPSLRDFNLDQRSASNLTSEDAETLCQTLPMMADRRVVIVRDVEAWNKRAKAKTAILRYLERPAQETILVLVQSGAEDDVDADLSKRTVSVAAEPLPPERAVKWAERHAERLGVTLEPDALQHLVKVTDASLSSIRTELEKVAGLAAGAPLTLERISELLGVRHGETQYDWRDAVLRGESGRAAAMLPHLLEQTGVSGVSLVSLLGTSMVGIGLARSLLDRGSRGPALVQAIRSALFRARPARLSYDAAAAEWSRLAPQWPAPRIEAALAALRRADERLKNTAVSDERAILFDLCMELSLSWSKAA